MIDFSMSALGENVDEGTTLSPGISSLSRSGGSTESQFRKMQKCSSTSSDWGNSLERGGLEEESNMHSGDRNTNIAGSATENKRRRNKLSSSSSGDSGIYGGISKTELRTLILGPTGVGKTSILEKFLGEAKIRQNKRSVHEVYAADVESSKLGEFSLVLEDTGGFFLSEFPAMAEISLNMADGIVLVFGLDSPATFDDMSTMRDKIIQRYKLQVS